jgi:hypothetical protein
MAKYLVTFNDQINDIEINGFRLMTEKEVESLEDLAASINWSFTYPLSNIELEYTSGDDYLDRLEFKEITNEEHKALKKVFNGKFGIFIGEDYLETLIDDIDSFDDEEEDFDDEEEDFDSFDDEDDDY